MNRHCAVVIMVLLVLATSACVGRAFQPDATPPPLPTAVPTLAIGTVLPATDARPITIDCLDTNHDGKVNDGDWRPDAKPDVTLDRVVDDHDRAILRGVDIALVTRCNNDQHQFLVESLAAMVPNCETFPKLAIILGITGAAPNGLTDGQDGKGIRTLVDELRKKAESSGFTTVGLVSTPNLESAENQHTAMENWLEQITSGLLTTYRCARLVIVGHSHGATSALAVASWLEKNRPTAQLAYVAIIDRVTLKYTGDKTSVPAHVPVFHQYELNEQDQTTEVCARNAQGTPTTRGQIGEPLGMADKTNIHEENVSSAGLCHSTIDDDVAVHTRIVDVVNTALNAPPKTQ